MNFLIEILAVDGHSCKYTILEECMKKGHTQDKVFIASFHRQNHDVQCNYMLFEFRGIIYRHCLVVPKKELKRWRQNMSL